MARTSRAERNRRRESALTLVSEEKSFSDVVTAQMANGSAVDVLRNGTVVGHTSSCSWAWIRTMLNI